MYDITNACFVSTLTIVAFTGIQKILKGGLGNLPLATEL